MVPISSIALPSKKISLLLFTGLLSLSVSSQDLKKIEDRAKIFKDRVTSNSFPPLGKWNNANGQEYNFTTISRPTIIRIGFRNCGPCKFEMKTFIKLSEKYPQIDFIYMTYDENKTIKSDISTYYPEVGKMQFISIPLTYIEGYRLTYGYPTTYFVDKGNLVQHVQLGGRIADEAKVWTLYTQLIDSVFRL